jgi:hypothetical protein
MTELTKKQADVIEWIREHVLDRKYGHTAASYEIKKFEVTLPLSAKGRAFLVVTTGLIGDEDTLAEVLCRDYRHIMIGSSGGTELLNPKKKGRTINRGLFHVLNNLAGH